MKVILVRKNNFYFLLVILTIIFLFSTAAICSQCAVKPEEEPDEDEDIPIDEEREEATEDAEKIEEESSEGIKEYIEEGRGGGDKRPRTAPTIKLEIYEGPIFLEGNRICYYRIFAMVTGEPAPTVEFSRDDSIGTLGPAKTQVTINYPGETYTLTATATNSMGSATDSIDLSWGCFIGVSIRASDLGYVIEDNGVNYETLIIGDSIQNRNVVGFFAFDVSSILSGKTIDYASLTLHTYKFWGDSTFKGKIIIHFCDYLPLTPEDYRIHPYTSPLSFDNDEDPIFYTSDYLKDIVQEKADSGEKLQFAINYESSSSDEDYRIDGREYKNLDDIYLAIKYFD